MQASRITLNLSRGMMLASALISTSAFPADSAAELLIKQGRAWQQQGDAERAADAWRKLLQIDARQPEAWYGMGMADISRGRLAQANNDLAQLRKVEDADLRVALLEQEIRLNSGGRREKLAEARALVDGGEQAKALAAYRDLFGTLQPQGLVALEYYRLLGYSPGGVAMARQGLARLVSQFPDDGQYALALAMLLLEQTSTRREGIRQLMRLSKDPQVGSQATEQWSNGLNWLGSPPPADALPLFRAYLAVHPDDAALRKQLQAGMQAETADKHRVEPAAGGSKHDSLARSLGQAMQALQAGEDAQAGKLFEQVLTAQPDNANALGGSGVLHLRAGQYADAEVLLARAALTEPQWRQALESARYLDDVEQGNQARYSGDRDRARALFEKAIALDPGQALGYVALAGLQTEAGQLDAAAATYQKVLSIHPQAPEAWRGLVGVLARSGQRDQAQRLIAHPPATLQTHAQDAAQLQAVYAAGLARAAERSGDEIAARKSWADAIRLDPADPWHRLGLAQNQMTSGNTGQAKATVDGLLKSQTDDANVLYVAAQLLAQAQDWPGTLAILDRIPATKRQHDMLVLQRRAQFNLQIGHATWLTGQGQQAKALEALKALEVQAGDQPDLIGALASADVDAGAPERGLDLLRAQLQRSSESSPELGLQYAGMLLKTGDDAGFTTVMQGLADATLDADEQANYAQLRRVEQIRQADALRQKGQLDAAEKTLAPVLAQRPDDTFALSAMARLRAAQGLPAQARAVYQGLLQRDPHNPALLLGAAQVSVQTGERTQARALADAAAAATPDRATVLLDAARVQRDSGNEIRAVQLYAQALLEQRRDTGTPASDRQAAADELAALDAQRSAQVTVGAFVRERDGSKGISQLSAIQAPMQLSLALGNGRLLLNATDVDLNAGALNGHNRYAAQTFGIGPLATASSLSGSQHDHGVGYSASYQLDGFSAELGLSPRGLLYHAVLGGLGYSGNFGAADQAWYALKLERAQVTDSLLSWAGTRDPRNGDAWGGVLRSGGLASVGRSFGDFSMYAYAGHDRFSGHAVLDNQRNQFGGGLQERLLHDDRRLLQVGLGMSMLRYDNNQDHFTYGHGGYFSPQHYVWVGVPVTWAWRDARLSYRVDASLGLQRVHQDLAVYFPVDSRLQQQAGLIYPGKDDSGLAYNLAAAFEYRLSRRLTLGGVAGFDNASDYSQWNAGIYLRIHAQPQPGLLALPVAPFRPPYTR